MVIFPSPPHRLQYDSTVTTDAVETGRWFQQEGQDANKAAAPISAASSPSRLMWISNRS